MKIELSTYYINKCKDFAAERMGGSADLYKYRGEQNISKMEEDIIIGTMAEWGVYKYLQSKGVAVTKPDMKIYEKRRKSFSADLINDKYRFHVKSQGIKSMKRYGASWLCQKTDRLLNNPEDDEYFVFTKVEDREVEILAIVKVKDIVENDLIGEPSVYQYRHTKRALYLDDILNSDIKLRRF